MIVDVDTADELEAFRASWQQNTDQPFPPMTVTSPGVQAVDGDWVHKGGGHFYFAVPDAVADVLARHVPGSLKVAQDGGAGWSLFWKDRQILVPPSIRPEGAYQLTGDVYPLPEWLLRYALTHIRQWNTRAEEQAARRVAAAESGELAAIDEWAAQISWSDLLEPDGWSDTGDVDRCGCPIWTAPGSHASPKSATAHEEGCAQYDDSAGHCPLHIWTDNPPDGLSGGGTYNKLRYLALTRYGSDSKDAQRRVCRDEGIRQEGGLLTSLIGFTGVDRAEEPRAVADQQVSPSATAPLQNAASPPPTAHLTGTNGTRNGTVNGHHATSLPTLDLPSQPASRDPLSPAGSVERPESPVPATTIPGDSLNATLTPLTPLPIPNSPQFDNETDTIGGNPDPQAELSAIPGEFGRKMRAAMDLLNTLPESMKPGMAEALDFEIKRSEARRFVADLERRDADNPPGSTWKPVDLSAALAGENTQVTPEIGLVRADGHALLYAGKEHTIIGEMESGKTWIALACAAAELNKGGRVLYIHFEESDPTGSVQRLLSLGVPAQTIAERFAFVAPEEPGDGEWIAELLDPAPALVVLDGVNEGMVLHGYSIREEDGAAMFRRMLVKPATRAGATVLSCDHVVKDPQARGRAAIGSVHKVNAVDGAVIMVENTKPFGRGRRGESRIFVTKDRPGAHRATGHETDIPGKTYMGKLIVDSSENLLTFTGGLVLRFEPPPPSAIDAAKEDPEVADDPLPAVHEPGLPEGPYVAEVAAVMKRDYEDNPEIGYTRGDVQRFFADREAATLTGSERKATRQRVSVAVKRAFNRLVSTGFLIVAEESVSTQSDRARYRWRGPDDGPRPGSEETPQGAPVAVLGAFTPRRFEGVDDPVDGASEDGSEDPPSP